MKNFSIFVRRSVSAFFASLVLMMALATSSFAQTTAFTYQGRLTDGAQAANGTYDLRFSLDSGDFLVSCNGAAATNNICQDVSVVNGIFTVRLDFGAAAFTGGTTQTLGIGVRRGDETGAFTPLAPAQPITSAPYAIRARSATAADTATTATTATNAQQLGGVAASQFTQNDSQTFIRNQTTQQAADFNVSGTGAANVFNAGVQYNIGGNRILSNVGTRNLIAGLGAGDLNAGFNNSFFGERAGQTNTTGYNNSFFGAFAGQLNTTSVGNSFFGAVVGVSNTTGANNSFFGSGAGQSNTTGSSNLFVGGGAGNSNTTGSNNTIVGRGASVGDVALTFATALGSNATVSTSNTVVLGRTADTVIAPNLLQVNALGAAGSTSLCRNTSNQISTCTAGNLAEKNQAAEQIDALREQVREQQVVINALKKLVCADNQAADICKE